MVAAAREKRLLPGASGARWAPTRLPATLRPRVWLGLLAFTCAYSGPKAAKAANAFRDPYDVPETPRAPTLPELTHGENEFTSETTLGFLLPSASTNDGARGRATALVQRFSWDAPLLNRRWFLGGNYELTTGDPSFGAGGTKVVSGNAEVYGRTVWATRTGLALGGGLALVAPIAKFDEASPAASVANVASSVRPWDTPMFASGYLTARPFFDVRAVDGPFVIQFRQGLDASLHVPNRNEGRIAGVASLYLGYAVARVLGLGIEAIEYYLIKAPVTDDRRVSFFVSPSIRLLTGTFQPIVSAYHSIGTPLDGPGASSAPVATVWGLRLALTVVLEKVTLRLSEE